MRCFIGIPITGKVAEALISFQKNIRGNIKFVEIENLHICLKFLEEVTENRLQLVQNVIKDVFGSMEGFEIEVTGAGGFPNPYKPRVLWVGVNGDFGFQKLLEDELAKLGFEKENRPFKPHITLGRVREGGVEMPNAGSFGKMRVEKVALIKSELGSKGPIYSEILGVKLK